LAIGDEEGRVKIYNLTRFIDWCPATNHELEKGFKEQREACFAQYGIAQDELLKRSNERIPLHLKVKDSLPTVH
jgi:hypothetical protein